MNTLKQISFESDYICGAHPAVLERLMEANLEPTSGYGSDAFTKAAKDKIRAALDLPEAEIFFLVGGTQTNQIAIDTLLAPYEGVLAARTGHINVHEAGAIELSGHKVIELDSVNGKISIPALKQWVSGFEADEVRDHMVFPGMLYISQPTEYGTLYSKEELRVLYEFCRQHGLRFYIDGARLAYALGSEANDVSLPELARLCDAFYIGGTKCGLLMGEALVFTHNNMPDHFLTRVKQHGALLAKGKLLGLQFDALFTDGLYEKIGHDAVSLAMRIKKTLLLRGYTLYMDSPTNQQFVVLDNEQYGAISEKVAMSFWEKPDENHTVVRLATSWSTTEDDVKELEKIL